VKILNNTYGNKGPNEVGGYGIVEQFIGLTDVGGVQLGRLQYLDGLERDIEESLVSLKKRS
jgi:hypothetical protein